MTSSRSATLFAFALLAPALIYILTIVAYPLVDTVILSFTNASLKATYDFIGWANYQRIFTAGNFTDVIIRTFIWTFFSVSLKMIIGMCGAVLLNAAIPGQTVFRILTMPPWIVPMAIGIFMWGWMYNGQFGMISGLLQNFGLTSKPIAWLAYGETAFWATIVTDVWIGVPIRPEHLQLGAGAVDFTITPRIVEHLGIHTVVYADLPAGENFIALFEGDPKVPEGEPLQVGFSLDQVHLFDSNGLAVY